MEGEEKLCVICVKVVFKERDEMSTERGCIYMTKSMAEN